MFPWKNKGIHICKLLRYPYSADHTRTQIKTLKAKCNVVSSTPLPPFTKAENIRTSRQSFLEI